MKSILTPNDYAYLKKKTKLSQNRLENLIEDPSDFNMVVDSICVGAKLKDLAKLSFFLKSRIILFQKTREFDINLKEKSYVADAVSQYHPEIIQKSVIKTIPKKNGPSEDQCRYFLVLYGLNSTRAKHIFRREHVDWIESGFARARQADVSRHTAIWLKILNSVENAGELLNSTPNLSLVPETSTKRLDLCVEV